MKPGYFYQHFLLYIDPVAVTIGSFSIRWYALAYIIGFAVVYWLLIYRIRKGELRIVNCESKTILQDFILVGFFSAIIGGRIGYFLFYDFSYFISNPLAMISPFDSTGNFVGLYGMSYHGGLIGIIIGSWIFLKIKKIPFLEWADFIVPAVSLGYFFGRIGNFLNGELYGRVTISSFGMYFAVDPSTLRFPSQLLEAILEGLVLFVILWNMRNKKMPKGSLLAIYVIGYGFFRITAEFWREPDPQIGFLFGLFTMGQLLSLIMIAIGASLFFKVRKNGILN